MLWPGPIRKNQKEAKEKEDLNEGASAPDSVPQER